MTKEMYDKISAFIEDEKKKFFDDYYEFKSDIFKEIAHDEKQEKAAAIVVERFNKFQKDLHDLFIIDDNYFDIHYIIPNKAIEAATTFQGVNPSDIVRDAIESLILVKQLVAYDKIEYDLSKNSMKLIAKENNNG